MSSTSTTLVTIRSDEAHTLTNKIVTDNHINVEKHELPHPPDEHINSDEFLSRVNTFIAQMYNNSLVPRNFVQFVINEVNDIFILFGNRTTFR